MKKKLCEKCGLGIDKSSFEKHYRVCPTENQKIEIIRLYENGNSIREIIELGFMCSMVKKSVKGKTRGKSKSKLCATKNNKCSFCNHNVDQQNFDRHIKLCELKNRFEKEILELYASGKSQRQIVALGYKKGVVGLVLKGRKRSKKEASKISIKNPHKWTDEEKRAQSEKVKERIKKGESKRWNIHWKRKKSYAEQEIYNYLIREGLKEHDDFFCEFPFQRYNADFYLPKLKLVIEVDSFIHETDEKRKTSDVRKDALLKSLGLDVMRIKWKVHISNRKNSFSKIDEIIKNKNENQILINEYNTAQLKHLALNEKIKIEIENKKKLLTLQKLEEKKEKIEIKKKNLLLSDIDFSKFGWVGQASKILQITPQKVCEWMRKNFPEFYENHCFQRGLR